MSAIDDVRQLEDRLREAELGPDPSFFEQHLADEAVIDGQKQKARIVEAHRPGHGPKFTRVAMSDLTLVETGPAVVVTCRGVYEGPNGSHTLDFMRVWLQVDGRWQIIAGSTSTG